MPFGTIYGRERYEARHFAGPIVFRALPISLRTAPRAVNMSKLHRDKYLKVRRTTSVYIGIPTTNTNSIVEFERRPVDQVCLAYSLIKFRAT